MSFDTLYGRHGVNSHTGVRNQAFWWPLDKHMEDKCKMDHQQSDQKAAGSGRHGAIQGVKDAAGDALSRASIAARDASAKATQAATDTASTVGGQVKEMLDKQIGVGATIAGHFANSTKLAADDLRTQAPLLAGVVQSFAGTVQNYAEGMKDQSTERLLREASDFTRRQPALVFGLAALAGFFVYRTFKNAQETASPSIQPDQDQRYG